MFRSVRDPSHTAKNKLFGKALALVGLSACLILSVIAWMSTFAWFSHNMTLSATGMELAVEVPAVLVISDDESSLRSDIASINEGSPFSVTLTADAEKIIPATHTAITGDNKTGLLYLPEGGDIKPETGLPGTADGDPAIASLLSDVPVRTSGDTCCYYVDYVVYIASASQALDATLTAKFLSPDEDLAGTFYAATIDFYLGDPAADTYCGTLNLAGTSYTNSGDALTAIELYNGVIPLNTDGALKVTMRFYFDGGLLEDATHTYVKNADLDLSQLTFGIQFNAEDNLTTP